MNEYHSEKTNLPNYTQAGLCLRWRSTKAKLKSTLNVGKDERKMLVCFIAEKI